MINEEVNYVKAQTIGDAWREVMWLCVKNGYDTVVKHGSYKGQIRRQLPFVTIVINEPGNRPLAPQVPQGCPVPTSDKKIEEIYFPEYLMSDKVKENEVYTYGSFIVPQLPRIIEILKTGDGNTNQACINIGDRSSVELNDPPCLRLIDFKKVDNKLNMTVYFRSWDLFAGLPENLGGLQLLKEYVLSEIEGLGLDDGKIIAHSSGLHIYDHFFDLADTLNVDKINVSEDVLREKKDFASVL